MSIRAAASALWLVPAALGAQEAATRWAVQLRTPVGVEFADLRLDGPRSRILLESHDSLFLPLSNLQRSGSQLSFTVVSLGLRAELDLSSEGTTMRGGARTADGGVTAWEGELIRPGTARWPVRPRVRVRQLALGSRANVTVIPASWVAALPDSMQLEREYVELVRLAGLPAVRVDERANRSRGMALGADEATRTVVRRQLQAIATSPAADSTFRRLFVGPSGVIIDVHERADALALSRSRGSYQRPLALRGLRRLGLLDETPGNDVARMREVTLASWPAWFRGDSAMIKAMARLAVDDPDARRNLNLLFECYLDAIPWWREAVQWLLDHPWLSTPQGARTPAQLMAAFWGATTLTTPVLLPEPLGGFAATPLLGGDRLGRRLLAPANASAAEWLVTERPAALALWHRLAWSDTLALGTAQGEVPLVAPAAAAGLAPLLAERDAIRIDPGIMPLLAVATVIHEWHHLLATGTRLDAPNGALREVGGVLRLREEDPWLAEGFAEWATEMTLAPARGAVPLLLLLDTEKRMALWGGMSEEPHALGYRLVRAAAARLPMATRRSSFVSRLDEPAALARLAHFSAASRGAPLLLRRPVTAAVVPEITLTWDAGVADAVTRRLLVPPYPPEH